MNENHDPLGAFTRGAALAAGRPDGFVRRRELGRPFHGVRTLVEPRTHGERAQAYRPRLRPGQFFSHLTAAVLFGVPLPGRRAEEDPIHVTVVDPARPPRCRGVIGHVVSPGRVLVVERHGLPVADAVTTWLHLGSVLAEKELVAVADHLLFTPRFDPGDRPFATREGLEAALRCFHGRGARALRSALALSSDAAASTPETELRLLILAAGLPEPAVNLPIRDGRRLLGIGDLAFPAWKVLVEYDGRHHQSSDAQFARDRRRLLDLHLAGWLVVTVRFEGLRSGRARTVEEIRSALRVHGWVG